MTEQLCSIGEEFRFKYELNYLEKLKLRGYAVFSTTSTSLFLLLLGDVIQT